ncbi:MAG TPA: hypothetical protein VKB45_09550 [Gemmatimonadales bacterium]|nr:hypothetical protein [Gemmatimonadales bacterium]
MGWFLFGGTNARSRARPGARESIDYDELEQAERDVREADDEDSVRDWGPGSTKPRPPHLL